MNINNKIFCVGGHKCGTFSLHIFFSNCGLKSIHGKRWALPVNNKLIINNQCFSDHFAEFGYAIKQFIRLIKQYPNAKFILNYRHLDPYITSVYKHLARETETNGNWTFDVTPGPFILTRIMNTHKTNKFIYEYMKKHNKMDQLLIINITNGKNEENTKLVKNFLGITNDVTITNNIHKIVQKVNIDNIFNKYIKHYNYVKNNIKITNKEYSKYLDEEYHKALVSIM